MLVEKLVSQFEALTLPKTQWTHQAHLRVGTWYVLQLGREKALPELRLRIRAYNEAMGTDNSDAGGYHETITRCYVDLISEVISQDLRIQSVDRWADVVIEKLGDPNLLRQFYSKDRLMSVVARRHWIEPDIKTLKFEG